ncbi:MAG: hypothetical protein ACUVQT_08775 [bacterium]
MIATYRGSGSEYRILTSVVEISTSCCVATGMAKYGSPDSPFTVLYWAKYNLYNRGFNLVDEKFYYITTFGHAEGYCIQKIDIGFIVVGAHWFENTGSSQDAQVYLLKLDEDGNGMVIRTFGGNDEDIGYYVQKTFDNGYIIAGCTRSFGNGGYYVYLIKTDASLNKQWERTYGGTKDDIGYSIQQTSDSGYIICGTSSSFSADGRDEIYFLRVDKYGNKLFEKTFGRPQYYCYGSSVNLTSDGGYILVGTERYAGDVPINKGDEVYCVYADPVNASTLLCYNPLFMMEFGSTGKTIQPMNFDLKLIGRLVRLVFIQQLERPMLI